MFCGYDPGRHSNAHKLNIQNPTKAVPTIKKPLPKSTVPKNPSTKQTGHSTLRKPNTPAKPQKKEKIDDDVTNALFIFTAMEGIASAAKTIGENALKQLNDLSTFTCSWSMNQNFYINFLGFAANSIRSSVDYLEKMKLEDNGNGLDAKVIENLSVMQHYICQACIYCASAAYTISNENYRDVYEQSIKTLETSIKFFDNTKQSDWTEDQHYLNNTLKPELETLEKVFLEYPAFIQDKQEKSEKKLCEELKQITSDDVINDKENEETALEFSAVETDVTMKKPLENSVFNDKENINEG